jgi:hypothetical protein
MHALQGERKTGGGEIEYPNFRRYKEVAMCFMIQKTLWSLLTILAFGCLAPPWWSPLQPKEQRFFYRSRRPPMTKVTQ